MRIPARAEGVARRIAAGTGLDEVLRLQRRVEDLEEAVAENTALALPLTEQIAALERSLIGPLQHRGRFVKRLQ